MKFIVGQAILGKIPFRDGTLPRYKRPYLIIKSSTDYIEVLNISSINGKEHKIAFKDNKELKKYNPPFVKPSFVKLDSLTRIYSVDWHNFKVLCNGLCLNNNELDAILKLIYK